METGLTNVLAEAHALCWSRRDGPWKDLVSRGPKATIQVRWLLRPVLDNLHG